MKKIIWWFVLLFAMFLAGYCSATTTVPVYSGGTGLYTVPANYVLLGSTTARLEARATSSLGLQPAGNYLIATTTWQDIIASSTLGKWFQFGANIYNGNSGNVGIGTTTPYAMLSVNGRGVFNQNVRADYYTATSTTVASTFPYASSTALTVSGFTYLTNLFIGNVLTTPVASLVVNKNTGSVPDFTQSTLHLVSADGVLNRLTMSVFGQSAITTYRRANGTSASPTKLLAGDRFGGFGIVGYNGSGAYGSAQNPLQIFAETDWNDNTNTPYYITLTTGLLNSSPLERMRITGAGLVGINTATPQAKLAVYDPSFTPVATYGVGKSPIMKVIGTANATGTAQEIGFIGWDTANYTPWATIGSVVETVNDGVNGGYNNAALTFTTRLKTDNSAPLERMRISAGGFVGIGTTTPQWALQVAKSSAPQLALSDTTLTSNHWTLRSVGNYLYFATSSPSTFSTSSMSALTIDANGYVGIGKVAPSTKLDVVGTASSTGLQVNGAGTITGTTTLNGFLKGGNNNLTDEMIVFGFKGSASPRLTTGNQLCAEHGMACAETYADQLTIYGTFPALGNCTQSYSVVNWKADCY